MNKYINKKTGAIVYSSSKISGGDWVLDEEILEGKAEKSEETEETEEETDLSKNEIMQELDSLGIEYNPKDKKEVLYNLMMGE